MSQELRRKKLRDGTYLVWVLGDNEHLNHWHVAPDGTVLSIKEGGDHKYKRSDIRKKIDDVLKGVGLDSSWSNGWVPK